MFAFLDFLYLSTSWNRILDFGVSIYLCIIMSPFWKLRCFVESTYLFWFLLLLFNSRLQLLFVSILLRFDAALCLWAKLLLIPKERHEHELIGKSFGPSLGWLTSAGIHRSFVARISQIPLLKWFIKMIHALNRSVLLKGSIRGLLLLFYSPSHSVSELGRLTVYHVEVMCFQKRAKLLLLLCLPSIFTYV